MSNNSLLTIWTVYARPKDYPNNFVAREFHIVKNMPPQPAGVIVCDTLADVRAAMRQRCLTVLPRSPGDESHIVESWI